MNLTVDYINRSGVRTVALTADFSLKDISLTADRLRSWARTSGVPIAGPPFLTFIGQLTCRVHLPVLADAMPHPETGIQLAASQAGEFARVQGVRFGEIRGLGRELRDLLGGTGPGDTLEFHSIDGDFFEGDLLVGLSKSANRRPVTLALTGSVAGTPPAAPSSGVRIVTIARQHGTGGEAVAESVARQLGYLLVDFEIFRRAAEQAGVAPETVQAAAVHRGLFARILDGLARSGGGGSPELWMAPVPLRASLWFTSADYRAFVEDAIKDLAEQGNVVILGHGAQLTLADRRDTFRALIVGGINRRADRAIAQSPMPLEEAKRVIREADQERVDYFREFYDSGWLDPSTYDLALNTDRTSVDDAAGIIVDAVRRRSLAGRARGTTVPELGPAAETARLRSQTPRDRQVPSQPSFAPLAATERQ